MMISVFSLKNIRNLIGVFLCSTIMLFSQESKIISIKDGIIHYKTFGQGEPILIINGGPGMNYEGFDAIAQEIADKGFQTIIYDQRGTGKSLISKVDSTTVTMKLMVEDIEYLRKHLKIKKWTVFGQSFGGILAAQYAHHHPESIDKIIFSSSGGLNLAFLETINQRLRRNLSETEQDSLNFYNQKLDKAPQNQDIILKRAHYLASAYVVQKKFIPLLAKRMTQVNFLINELVFNDLIKNKFDMSLNFKTFKRPVLIFQGENDVISIETAQNIHQAFPNSNLVLIENCGHYPWLDQHDLFFTELVTFLNTK